MKKAWWLIIIGGVVVSGVVAVLLVSWFVWKMMSTRQPTDPVPYDKSYGTICPVGLQFIASKDGATVDCQCPDGYTKDSIMIGSSSGDACYGPGTECPIFSVTCILK
ncbi:MAG: hypothetical protein WCV88_04640 [Patescibacteria group bacterium]